jgi:zinc protease
MARRRAKMGWRPSKTAVDAEIAKIVKDGISDSELEKAKNRYLRSLIFARDNQSGMANLYGGSLTTGNTVQDVQQWPERIRAVTAAQVQAVAAKYLKPNTSVASYLLPKAEAPKAQN